MPLTAKHVRDIRRTIKSLQALLGSADDGEAKTNAVKGKSAKSEPRARRTGKDLLAFQKTLAAERRRGVPVAELAKQYGVTPSYIYQLRPAPAPQKAKSKAAAKPQKSPAKKSPGRPKQNEVPADGP